MDDTPHLVISDTHLACSTHMRCSYIYFISNLMAHTKLSIYYYTFFTSLFFVLRFWCHHVKNTRFYTLCGTIVNKLCRRLQSSSSVFIFLDFSKKKRDLSLFIFRSLDAADFSLTKSTLFHFE